jgi:hypothetical protein
MKPDAQVGHRRMGYEPFPSRQLEKGVVGLHLGVEPAHEVQKRCRHQFHSFPLIGKPPKADSIGGGPSRDAPPNKPQNARISIVNALAVNYNSLIRPG